MLVFVRWVDFSAATLFSSCVMFLAVVFAGCTGTTLSRRQDAPAAAQSPCRVSGALVRVPGLSEGSGIAASRRTPGVLWAHNDSGEPALVRLDTQGSIAGRVRVSGAAVEDWEDIAVGPCPQGSCLYIGDIGDNRGRRDHIVVYRTGEPAPEDQATGPVERFQATYPDGAHDAESLFVTPQADLFIITKGDPGPIALYRFPRPLQNGASVRLERVGEPLSTGQVDGEARPTSADASPDGEWVAVRTTRWVALYRTMDLTAGRWQEISRTDVSALREPRGEGVAFGENGTLFLLGEGGFASSRGSFARLACTLAPIR
jgi:hypothetical protein